jgi:hypothetical protein
MGYRFVRINEELDLQSIHQRDGDIEFLFSNSELENRNITIKVILFSVEKDAGFEYNLLKLQKVKDQNKKIVTIHDDITEDLSTISFYYEEGKFKERIAFSTKEVDGLEVLFSI